jgi:hypothetical protein
MAYEVETNPYLGLVVCTMWGVVWVEERHAALDATLAQITPGKPYRVLVDMIGASCANDSLEASGVFAQRLAQRTQVARLPNRVSLSATTRINHAVEKLAEARAFRFRRFSAMSDALDWLLAPPPRLRVAPPIEAQVEPDAVTLLAGFAQPGVGSPEPQPASAMTARAARSTSSGVFTRLGASRA